MNTTKAPDWFVWIFAADETMLAGALFPSGEGIALDDVVRSAHLFITLADAQGTQIQITTDERPHRIVYVWRDGEVLIDERRGDPTPNAPDSPGPWPIHSKDGRAWV